MCVCLFVFFVVFFWGGEYFSEKDEKIYIQIVRYKTRQRVRGKYKKTQR